MINLSTFCGRSNLMKICPICEIRSNDERCPKCGRLMVGAICDHCGTTISPHKEHCPACGQYYSE